MNHYKHRNIFNPGAQDATGASKTTEDDQIYYRAKTKPLKGK